MSFRITYPKFKAIAPTGSPLSGGLLYTYEPGTTTPKAVYTSSDASTPHTNPVVLDSLGEQAIFATGRVKLVLKNAADELLWTEDDVGDVESGGEVGESGTYTPTELNNYNLNEDLTEFFETTYMRIGDVVTVSGRISVTPYNGASPCSIRISVPLGSAANNIGGGSAAVQSGVWHSSGAVQIESASVYNNYQSSINIIFPSISMEEHEISFIAQYAYYIEA